MTNATPLAVYIHWPFCKAKCPYCDFNSHVREGVEQGRWRNALLSELEWMASRLPQHQLSSIFFGGGTPSLMPPETVAALIERTKALFPSRVEPEITLEANPTSVEAANFRHLRDAGVNRVSLGVQSLRAEGLKFLGREHSAREALAAVELAAETFPRYSFDLIYARPGQTPNDWEVELREALPYIGGHASLYQLTIEEDTPFARFYAAGDFTLPEEEDAARMYERTAEILGEKGLLPYEISNYAKPGQECFHNLEIWRGSPYLGIGPGAHGRSFFNSSPSAPFFRSLRLTPTAPVNAGAPMARNSGLGRPSGLPSLYATSTLKSPERWLAQVEKDGHGLDNAIPVTEAERFEEQVLMGLRLSEGVDLSRLNCPERTERLLNSAPLKEMVRSGVMEINAMRIHLTPSGRLLLDTIVAKLLIA